MFNLFKRRIQTPLGSMAVNYDAVRKALERKKYKRSLRVFVSHRWERDKELHEFFSTRFNGFEIEDLSLSQERRLAGRRGGSLDNLMIKQEIAARIFASDIVIAPSSKSAGWSDWVAWEVATAAICYNIPILFIDASENVVRRTSLVRSLQAAGARVGISTTAPDKIIAEINKLFDSGILVFEDADSEDDELRRNHQPREFYRIMKHHGYLSPEATKRPLLL